MDEKIFDRVEKKYLISKAQYTAVADKVRKFTQKDNYHKSLVFNVYFDTDNYDLIIQSIDQPIFKEKLRARSYGGYDKVFLEIKTKLRREGFLEEQDNNIGYKRRVLITHKDYEQLLAGKHTMRELAARHIEKDSDLQIADEIDYMIKRFDLKPRIMVYYDRESYKGEHGLRLTFDTDLRYRTDSLKFRTRQKDQAVFPDQHCIIMEIKAHGSIPLWLVHAMSTEHIYPQRFSKIGTVYEQIRKEQNV